MQLSMRKGYTEVTGPAKDLTLIKRLCPSRLEPNSQILYPHSYGSHPPTFLEKVDA